MDLLIIALMLWFSHSMPLSVIIRLRSAFFLRSKSLQSLFVGCFARINTDAFPPLLYFLTTSRKPSEFSIYSLASVVCIAESIIIDSGNSEKHAEITVSLSPFLDAWILRSILSILITPFPSLKKISNASRIVDLPMSFLPTNTVRLLKPITVSSL